MSSNYRWLQSGDIVRLASDLGWRHVIVRLGIIESYICDGSIKATWFADSGQEYVLPRKLRLYLRPNP